MPALAGVSVLVTRPAHQAGPLVEKIEAAGGRAVIFPAVEIGDVEDDAALQAVLGRIATYDLAIFVSANAVEKAYERMGAFPEGLRCAAVGKATMRALEAHGIERVLIPETGFDSEGLLELSELKHVEGSRIVIFRGVGGRELLAEELRKRGAQVDYAECYRRIRPAHHPVLAEDSIQAVTATSGEIVVNLCAMTEDWVRRKPIFLTHERIGEIARQCGFGQVVVAQGGEAGLLDALMKWFEFGDKTHG